jgi:Mn2+/Fe2+ NRAMP family transporter
LIVPAVPAGSIVLVAAILSWMPTGIDVSVWHSFWTIEKMRQLDPGGAGAGKSARQHRLTMALLDMRIGYALSLSTGVMFVILGAVHLSGRGAELQGVEFAEALSSAYTTIFGRWMYHVFMLTAFFAMFSTSYTVIDGFSRSFSECCGVLFSSLAAPRSRKALYLGFAAGSALLAGAILLRARNPVTLVTVAALISLAAAPLLYGFNLYCVWHDVEEPRFRPPKATLGIACAGIAFMLVALATTVYVTLMPR